MSKIFEQRYDQLGHLPEQILFALANNPSADWRMRKAAVELMLEKKYPKAQHPDLYHIYSEVIAEQTAKSEVEEIIETAVETPFEEIPALKAGFTTASMFQESEIPINKLEV